MATAMGERAHACHRANVLRAFMTVAMALAGFWNNVPLAITKTVMAVAWNMGSAPMAITMAGWARVFCWANAHRVFMTTAKAFAWW